MIPLPDNLAAEIPKLRTFGGSEINLPELLRIDPGNLVNEYQCHPGWQALIAFQHATAQLNTERAERKVKALRADKWLFLKESFEGLYGFKPTETALEAAVRSNPDVNTALDDLMEAKCVESIWEVARNAFLARKDMLINLGAHERAEHRIGPAT